MDRFSRDEHESRNLQNELLHLPLLIRLAQIGSQLSAREQGADQTGSATRYTIPAAARSSARRFARSNRAIAPQVFV